MREVLLFVLSTLAANTSPPYNDPWCWEGRPCTNKEQCKQDNGQTGACCNGLCRQAPIPRGEACGTSLVGDGCPGCGSNLKCSTDTHRCEAEKVANGCLCNATGTTGNAGCLGGNCLISGTCGATNVFPGGFCEEDNQCISKNCTNSSCAATASGQACTKDTDFNECGPGQVCLSNGKCGDILTLSQTCNEDYECAQPDLYCASNKRCANRTAPGGACTGTSCTAGFVCNNNTCTPLRSVAATGACSLDNACVSLMCGGGTCTATHFLSPGATCTNDIECPYYAACNSEKKCTISSLGAPCNPTLSGGAMDAQCMGSKDTYCACSGKCLATATSILPPSTNQSSDECEQAHDVVGGLGGFFKDLTKVDLSPLTSAQRVAVATNACCKDCNKDKRVSAEGFQVDCKTKTVSTLQQSCDINAADPLALANCPNPELADSLAFSLIPGFGAVTSLCFVNQLV